MRELDSKNSKLGTEFGYGMETGPQEFRSWSLLESSLTHKFVALGGSSEAPV